jgi:hypothetical protein
VTRVNGELLQLPFAEKQIVKTQAYLVTRTDQPAGLSIRARSAEEAIKKAQRWPWMRNAAGYRARLIFASAPALVTRRGDQS